MDNLNTPYNAMLRFESNYMSDFEASIQLNHKKVDQTSFVCQKDGIDLYLCGCLTVLTSDGEFLVGSGVMAEIYTQVNATKEEVIRFLEGEDNDKFNGYTVKSNPWFEWQDRDGETVGEPIHEIPASIVLLTVGE